MFISAIAILVALFFAVNIGASGTAAAMGAAYGGGAIRKVKIALWLVAGFAIAGALLGSEEVVTTISQGIIADSFLTVEPSVMILLSACLSLYFANRLGIPLSTSEVTVGSLVGAGLAYGHVYWSTLGIIVFAWLLTPILAFFVAYGLGKLFSGLDRRIMQNAKARVRSILSGLLIICGCFEAFSAGMNNVANAVGPIIGANIVESGTGIFLGAIFMGIGAIVLGKRVLETNGKKITKISLLQGSIVSFTGGSLVVFASLFGIPIPLTQASTMAIIGVGGEKVGLHILKKPIVRRIMLIWVISPISSLLLSFALIKLVLGHSMLYGITFILLSMIGIIYYQMRMNRDQLFLMKQKKPF